MINMYFEFQLDNHYLKSNLYCYTETRCRNDFCPSL